MLSILVEKELKAIVLSPKFFATFGVCSALILLSVFVGIQEHREAIDRHGVDALRYFLLREIPWDANGNFDFDRFDGRYEAELADGYGNLSSRVLAMIVRYLDGKIPENGETTSLDTEGEEGSHKCPITPDQTWRPVDAATRASGR